MDFAGIQTALASWVTNSTGIPAVWYNQVRPNLPRPFATLQMIAMRGIGRDENRYSEVTAPEQAATFTVIVDGTGSPNTFKWQKNIGSFTTGVTMTTGAHALSNGVTITFSASTGHTLGDQWTIVADTSIHAPVFSGSGLNDASSGGVFSPSNVTQLQPTTTGFRQLSIRMRVISRDQRPGFDGMYYTELARTSLRRPLIETAYQAAGLAFVEAIPITIADAVFDDRMESIAVLDVKFNVAENLTINTDIESYIKKADIEIETAPEDLEIHQVFGDINGT